MCWSWTLETPSVVASSSSGSGWVTVCFLTRQTSRLIHRRRCGKRGRGSHLPEQKTGWHVPDSNPPRRKRSSTSRRPFVVWSLCCARRMRSVGTVNRRRERPGLLEPQPHGADRGPDQIRDKVWDNSTLDAQLKRHYNNGGCTRCKIFGAPEEQDFSAHDKSVIKNKKNPTFKSY